MQANSGLQYASGAHAKLEHPYRQSPSKHQSDHQTINVGEMERQASMIGGTVLAVCGLLRGSLSGLALAAIGGGLIWRGHTGHCEMYHALGMNTAEGCRSCHDE
jgi:uncharacterized membrane protein